jgi:hypothetical protein
MEVDIMKTKEPETIQTHMLVISYRLLQLGIGLFLVPHGRRSFEMD